jgi:hypothetical protein
MTDASGNERTLPSLGQSHGISERDHALQKDAPLPGDYRVFLADLGWLAAGHYEIFGLGEDAPMHLNLVEMTLDERSNFGLPENLIPIMKNGRGDLYCFDGSGARGRKVLLWDHESSPRRGAFLAGESFSAWLLGLLESI